MNHEQSRAIRIVVIGSSTAAGTGAQPESQSWVNRYRAYLQSRNPANEVINLGLGGLQTFQLLPTGHRPPPARPLPDPERNITRALSFHPDAVIVNAPSNDAAAYYGVAEQMANFEAIDRAARAAGVPVWIGTPQPRRFGDPAQIAIQTGLREAVSARFGAYALDFWKGLATPAGLPEARIDSGDGAHLNNAGHALLFERVVAAGLPGVLAHRPAQAGLRPDARVLHIPALCTGRVWVEVYDPLARLRAKAQGALPLDVPIRKGLSGTYWVRVAGASFNRLLAWQRL